MKVLIVVGLMLDMFQASGELFLPAPAASAKGIYRVFLAHAICMSTLYAVPHKDPNQLAEYASLQSKQINGTCFIQIVRR